LAWLSAWEEFVHVLMDFQLRYFTASKIASMPALCNLTEVHLQLWEL
jgi:hypothetical protein